MSIDLTNLYNFLENKYIQFDTIADSLTINNSKRPLSSKQGYILKGYIDGKSDINHTHSNYLTSSDINGKADSSNFDTLTVTVNYTDNTSETVTFYVMPNNNNSS